MLKYVNNLCVEPSIKISAKYLSNTGSVSKDSTTKAYPITSSGAVLIKVSISKFDGNSFNAVKTKLSLKIKKVYDNSEFQLHQITNTSFSKNKRQDVTLGTLVDTILYKGKSSEYATLEDVLDFDLTKHFHNYLKGMSKSSTKDLYFALVTNNYLFHMCDLGELVSTNVIVDMQMNSIKGLDGIYEFDQEEIGCAGVANINLANGKMIHKVEAIQTDNDENPAAFHLFYNTDRRSRTGILGDYWTFSGEYDINLNANNGFIELTDSTNKTLILQRCTIEDIKQVYDIKAIEPFPGDYYLCLSEAMYGIVKDGDENTIIFVDKNSNKMYFETFYLNLTKIELGTGKTITFTYSNNKVTRITDGDGQYIDISYSNSKVSKVEHYNKIGVKLGYLDITISNNRIDSIKSYIANETVCVNEAKFSYDSSNRLSLISDVTGGISSCFEYSSQNEVVRVEHIFNSDPDKQKYTTYDYQTFQTIVTDYTGYSTNYYFDYYGRCKSIIDCEAKSVTRNYDEVTNNNPGNLNSESKLQINERNLIDNSSFDSSDDLFENGSSWLLSSGMKGDVKIVDGGVYGQKCLRVTANNTAMTKITQTLKNVIPGSYTFKAFFKAIANRDNGVKVNQMSAKINVKYTEKVETTTTTIGKSYNTNITTSTNHYIRSKDYELTNKLAGTFDWINYETTGVLIPSGSNISNLVVTLTLTLLGGGYTAYIDDLSLSYGDHIVRYNFVNNGYFENSLSGWTLENGTTNDGIITYASNDGHHKVLAIKY